ncbi:helix-turn-helix domain-containing protein [Sporosarcina sp. FSL K6-1508]|uniref:helix-turn-helix domain-containing protein n=1 Tax=Sporosarcina sp. FSL K6-1508 TaxID=2921553 RepID=UPI0030F6205D
MNYGSILKACRERSGLSQSELAFRLFINQSDVSKLENGSKEPSMSTFQKWSTATSSPDVLVAFIAGMDGLTILANVLSTMGSAVTGFINLLI